MKYLLGVLNAKLYFVWLYFMGKRKGEALELYQKPLSEIPIKSVDGKVQQKVVKVVERLMKKPGDESAFEELNSLVYEIHGLTKSEIKLVEEFYSEKAKNIASDDEDGLDEEEAA